METVRLQLPGSRGARRIVFSSVFLACAGIGTAVVITRDQPTGPCGSIDVHRRDDPTPRDRPSSFDPDLVVLRTDSSNMEGAYAPLVIQRDGLVVGPTNDGSFRQAVLSDVTVAALRACLTDDRFQSSPSYANTMGQAGDGKFCEVADLSIVTYTAPATSGGAKSVAVREPVNLPRGEASCDLEEPPQWLVDLVQATGRIADIVAASGEPAAPPPSDLAPR
jgi:hypothetical protein